ncbi:MAG: tyrosine--tRNA ligase [Anaerolineae bacterium]|nr:tyrosine--tRNA ligase [Anaerolineae bacterium]
MTTTAANFVEEMRWRGLLNNISEGAEDILAREKITAYIGFDPTADSLHVGSLLPIMVLAHLQRHGHTPIALVGGGTGMIGDPSGKSKERNLLDEETLTKNQAGIRAQLSRFLDFSGVPNLAHLANNIDWLGPITMMEFLRDIGKHFTVNYMLAKDSVKTRLNSEEGISYTEFSYMLLQAYDFLVLFDRYGCTFQMGGSDQWGNIVGGFELVRRLRGGRAHGLTVPLITTSSGTKFGKTEAGTVWLSAERTSPFRFYQFWLNTSDDDAVRYLKCFTFLGPDEIGALEDGLRNHPEQREAQRTLAQVVTRMVHGEEALMRAEQATQVLFGGSLDGLSAAELLDIFAEVPSSTVTAAELQGEGLPTVALAQRVNFETSNGRARQLIESGGLYANNRRIDDPNGSIGIAEAIDGRVIVLRKGRKNYHLVRVQG